MQPEQDPNAANAQEGEKYTLTWAEEKQLLQDFEDLNTPRDNFKPLEIWQRNVEFYGGPRSARRLAFIQYWSNHMKRPFPIKYLSNLEKHQVKMGTATRDLVFAVDSKNGDTGVQKEVKFLGAEDRPPVFRDENGDELTSISHRIKEIQFPKTQRFRQPDFGGFETPPGKHNVNGSVSSPNKSFDAGFGSPARDVPSFHLPPNYVWEGSEELPSPLYFHPDGNGHRNGVVFIAQGNMTKDQQQHNILSLEFTCAPDDMDKYSMKLATLDELPECYKQYVGRAIIFVKPTVDFFNAETTQFEEKHGDIDTIVMARQAAETEIIKVPELAKTYFVILFPFSMKEFDNSLFSSHPHNITVNRITPVKTTEAQSAYGKCMYATTLTWVIAMSGQRRDLAGTKPLIKNKSSLFD